MARATRSSTQQDQPKPIASPSKSRKTGSKKRKRLSLADATELPLAKQPRTVGQILEEGSQHSVLHPPPPNTSPLDLPSSGDVPLHPDLAAKILETLEAVDTQGLLDRVFPLSPQSDEPTSPLSVPGPSPNPHTHSFRSLLQDPSNHPLRVLRSAVQHLFPISSHPRSRPSATVAEQLRFCNLVLSLLDQASSHSAPIPLNSESIISEYTQGEASSSGALTSSNTSRYIHRPKRKYALVQRLPTGDWWSSANSSFPPTGKELTDLPTAHAELVQIIPSSSFTPSLGHTLTLADYVKPSPTANYFPHEPRRVACGRFLDYGPYASFAPIFDQEGAEVGRVGLGETIWHQERKRRNRGNSFASLTAPAPASDAGDSVNSVDPAPNAHGDFISVEEGGPSESLDTLLSPDQVSTLKSALGSLELEQAVQELLTRNGKALQRLEELQLERLGCEGGGSSTVTVGSEEWEIAQGILGSLTVLASLRPRSSSDDSERPPLIPSASALRKLHRTLPLESTGGWYGTLPPGRTTALRDDSTIHIKPGVVAPAPAAPITPAATAPSTPVTKPQQQAPAAPYNYSAYPGYNAAQYRGGYGTYTPGQSGSYYSNYQATQQAATAAAHYPSTQYSAAGQHQYSYSTSWYNYQPPTPQTAGTSSGRATPQPVVPTTNYSGYTQQPQPQRAVANTVVTTAAAKGYQSGPWPRPTTGAGFVAPTLPVHLRTSGGDGSTPGTPTPVSAGSNLAGTYGGHATSTQFSAR